jgi:hypothetical protein
MHRLSPRFKPTSGSLEASVVRTEVFASRGSRRGRSECGSRAQPVDASEYVFRTSTQIETAAPDLDWLNKGVFISVAGRQPGRVVYEVYLVA